MGLALMSGELHELSAEIGSLKAQVRILTQTVRDNQESATEEHRKVHDIVVATSEAVRNLATKVDEMKPLTDDYREKRAEARGAVYLARFLYVTVGGIVGAFAAKAIEVASLRWPS
jgi:hypothetical protein